MKNKSMKARLAAYLVDSGETRDDVSQKLGISRRSLQKKLEGETELKFSEAIALSRMFGCTVSDLAADYSMRK